MYKIGLTGGIAAGKSTVLDWFKAKGVQVIDADLVAREVVLPGSEGLKKLVKAFGKEILTKDNALDRQKLGEIIFAKEEKRNQLNSILHAEIWERMEYLASQYEKAGEPAIIYDVPLLIETGWHKRMNEVWLVYVSLEIQIERLCLRNGLTKEEALQRINSQMLLDKKKNFSDVIIENNSTREKLAETLEKLWVVKKSLWHPTMRTR